MSHRAASLLLSAVLLGAAPAGAAPLPPPDADALLRAARAARRAGDYDRAAGHLKECARRGEQATAHALEALLLRVERGEPAAIKQVRRELAGARGEYFALIAEALTRADLRQGRLDEAEELLDRWQALRPSDPEAAFCRGLARQRRADLIPRKAGPLEVLLVTPGFGGLPWADRWDDEGARNAQLDGAAESFRSALRINPSHREARLLLATVLLDLDRPKEAVAHLEHFGKDTQEDPRVLLALGRCRARLGEETPARGLLEAVLARDPKSAAALSELGRLDLRAGRYGKAEERLSKAHALRPKNLGVLKALRECQTRLEKKEAVEELDKQLDQLRQIDEFVEGRTKQLHDPQYADKEQLLRAEIGRLHGEAGRSVLALYWAQGALRVDPSCGYAHGILKKLYEAEGMRELADYHAGRAARPKEDGAENTR